MLQALTRQSRQAPQAQQPTNAALGALQVDKGAAQDPSYLAFIRGAGYNEAEQMADVARRQGQLGRQMARNAPRFDDEIRTGQAQISDQYATSGLFRSGARMGAQADQYTDVQRKRLEYNATAMDEMDDVRAGALRNIAELRRQAADRALSARADIALSNAQAGVR